MKKIIMILTNGFDPDPRVYKEAKTLVQAGHDVEILCWDRENKYLDKENDIIDGIKIKRFFTKSKYGSGHKQFLAYLKFMKEVKKYMRGKRCDALHCHDFDGLLIGSNLAKKDKSIKLVYDQHDLLYNYFMRRKGLFNKIIYKYIKYKEKILLKKVDTHIVVSPNMAKLYDGHRNILIINNAPYKTSFTDIKKEDRNKIVIGFIGGVRHYSQLKLLIDCSLDFKEHIDILLIGRGLALDKLKKYCLEHNVPHVSFAGGFKMSELEKLYKQIDITYAVYPKTAIVSMPNKFFESIITETPIIADVNTEFGKIVEDKKFGFVINSNQEVSTQLKDILRKIINDKNILNVIKSNMSKEKNKYCWENNIESLLSIYE